MWKVTLNGGVGGGTRGEEEWETNRKSRPEYQSMSLLQPEHVIVLLNQWLEASDLSSLDAPQKEAVMIRCSTEMTKEAELPRPPAQVTNFRHIAEKTDDGSFAISISPTRRNLSQVTEAGQRPAIPHGAADDGSEGRKKPELSNWEEESVGFVKQVRSQSHPGLLSISTWGYTVCQDLLGCYKAIAEARRAA